MVAHLVWIISYLTRLSLLLNAYQKVADLKEKDYEKISGRKSSADGEISPRAIWKCDSLMQHGLHLNMDTTIHYSVGLISIRGVFRDKSGVLMATFSQPLQGSFPVEVAEFEALRYGLSFAHAYNLHL
ncbi:Ribonuclease H domain [Abeliophyllum distichum]|uniref:Ribonuclease H domain n=1 Tax=Abeliophyllum distichum TaxID=126358 RepID=A0ABD1Q4H0_9LAMI